MNNRMATGSIPDLAGPTNGSSLIESAILKFSDIHPTVIQCHPETCCRVAHEWFRGQSRAHHAMSGLPAPWLRLRWRWGPLERPIHWCQIVERDTIDCGALSALTFESMMAIGEAAWFVQLIQNFDIGMVGDWEHFWRNHGGSYWTFGPLVYHECIGFRASLQNGIRIWDPTVETLSDQQPLVGHDSIAAIRVLQNDRDDSPSQKYFDWRGFRLHFNEWCAVGES